jgi:hypothetical protein
MITPRWHLQEEHAAATRSGDLVFSPGERERTEHRHNDAFKKGTTSVYIAFVA